MKPVQSTKNLVILADQHAISVAELHETGNWSILESLDILAPNPEADESIPLLEGPLLAEQSGLLIIPDYWISSLSYPFASEAYKLVEAFLERKLPTEIPFKGRIAAYYDYFFLDSEQQRENLCVYYLAEEQAYTLIEQLASADYHPKYISSPALLWKARLSKSNDGFLDTTSGLIDLEGIDCNLYFYDKGRFLFSRSITLPSAQDETVNFLLYELNQSLRLVSQRARAQVETIYIHSTYPNIYEALKDQINPALIDLPPAPAKAQDAAFKFPELLFMEATDLKMDDQSWSLLSRDYVRKQRQKPIQLIYGIAGLVFTLLMVAKTLFISAWDHIPPNHGALSPPEVSEKLNQYQSALDALIARQNQPSFQQVLSRLAQATPASMKIDTLKINRNNSSKLELSALLSAPTIKSLSQDLKGLQAGLSEAFPGAQDFKIAEFMIEKSDRNANATTPQFSIQFEVEDL